MLIAALLGLGVGMLLASRKAWLALYFPAGLLVLTAITLFLGRQNIALPIVLSGQYVWGNHQGLLTGGILGYFVLVAFFVVMVGVFLLIGQEVGRALTAFKPLAAYSQNILGSLVGVLAFALLNWLDTPPTVWFGFGMGAFAVYMALACGARPRLLLTLVPLVGVFGLLVADALSTPAGVKTYWSPYYKVQVSPMVMDHQRVGYGITVNKDALQFALNLSGKFNYIPRMRAEQHQYNLPYRFVHPKRVLVLGAGSGNDVAAAIRNAPNARIDAVEIDPVVAQIGRQLHPEHPYSNPHVHLYVTDARSFLQQNHKKYNLIVFGKLDSHRVFSHMSSVRMDNYVYTLQDFQNVRKHLAPGGIVALGFVMHEKWIADRLYTMLDKVFGHPPLVYETNQLAYDTIFYIGNRPLSPPPGEPVLNHAKVEREILGYGTWHYNMMQGFLDPHILSTHSTLLSDDWPYLYMRSRTITPDYLIVLVLTIIVSVLLVWLTVPRIDFRSSRNWIFLLLGAGFALQETKGITDIALLFGSTWITNIIVISSILLVILLANLAVSRLNIPVQVAYLGLFALLVLNFLLPLNGLLAYPFWAQVLGSGFRVAAPIFFSGIIFAWWFARTDRTSSALGANLMGAVVGGLSEYSSLALGLNDLYLIAIAFYGLAFVLGLRPELRTVTSRQLVPTEA